jgi:hypothetical protein
MSSTDADRLEMKKGGVVISFRTAVTPVIHEVENKVAQSVPLSDV